MRANAKKAQQMHHKDHRVEEVFATFWVFITQKDDIIFFILFIRQKRRIVRL